MPKPYVSVKLLHRVRDKNINVQTRFERNFRHGDAGFYDFWPQASSERARSQIVHTKKHARAYAYQAATAEEAEGVEVMAGTRPGNPTKAGQKFFQDVC